MVRKPIVAGQFYEADKNKLKKQIEGCFLSELGPGSLPIDKRNKKIFGAIVPHAGIPYSGPCAAHVYKEIGEAELPDLYILLGTNHGGMGGSCISLEDWQTPFGTVKVHEMFAKHLISVSSIKENSTAHQYEHSIEVQLPFLQYVNKHYLRSLRIVPINVSHDYGYEELAVNLKQAITETKKKVCIIVSGDFTHYGVNYGFAPFTTNIKENLYGLDKGAIDYIKKLDAWSFLHYVKDKKATICGSAPIATLVELSRIMKKKNVELLKYYTSADIIGDYNNAVGYASIIIK